MSKEFDLEREKNVIIESVMAWVQAMGDSPGKTLTIDLGEQLDAFARRAQEAAYKRAAYLSCERYEHACKYRKALEENKK